MVGDGARRYSDVLRTLAGVEMGDPSDDHPSAVSLVELALTRPSVPLAEITPMYLRARGRPHRLGGAASPAPAAQASPVSLLRPRHGWPWLTPPAGRAAQPEPEAIEVHLVPLRRRHLRSVLRIEAQVYPQPWSLTLFMSELNLRSSRSLHRGPGRRELVGYAGLMFSGDEAHVTTMAVDPEWHRRKIGTRLLLSLARAAAARGVAPPDPRGAGSQQLPPKPCTASSA